ncbi:MAG: peptidase M16 [Dehalococcoidales bacterium]|jgi:predicted Zn-dependent peptidase|nr:peptidase M16 [Dehalococcoidales bacterium]|tara:strand:+ start:727 stop:2019 length:1293 start_codon:yes stop_codon:yes gene_type:complete
MTYHQAGGKVLYQKTTLDNGLRLVTANMPHTHSVCIGIFVGVGSRYETESEAGISHFIEHLCFKGTQQRPTAREISEAIEGVGGILNGGTDKELTVYWCKVAQSHFPLALDVLTDMLLHSRFDPPEIEKERRVIIEEIKMGKDSPSQWVNILIDDLLWPNHPLGRDVAGSKESVSAITGDRMLGYLQSQYLPGNSVVAVAGNIQHDEVLAAVSQALGDWTSQPERPGCLAYKPELAQRLQVETRDIEQAHLCLALPGLSLLHPRRFTVDLLNIILGGGMSSRLFAEIRDKLGLAYSIQSYAEHFLDSGSVTVYAGVEPKNLKTAIKAILEQLAKLKEQVPETELSKAKELSKGRLLLRMEDSRNVAGWVGGQEVLSERILSVDQVISIIEAITAEELKQLARELMVGSQLRLAVVGPVVSSESLEELLKL